MRACFPVAHDRGLESRVYPHFGSAPLFLVVDADTRAVRAVANGHSEHEHGHCNPLDALAGEKVDAVVVGGIGPGALGQLREAGISVYHTSRATVGEALDAIARGAPLPVVAEDSHRCGHGGGSGSGHGHRCREHHGAGHGRG
jgi:predicted Fe-Mo cluster-binding NifX family protein